VFTSSGKGLPQAARVSGRLLKSPDNQTQEQQQVRLRRRLPEAGWHPTRFNPSFAPTLLGARKSRPC